MVLTRSPAREIAFIHDRMPVLLPRERIAEWIDPGVDAARALEGALQSVCFERVAPDVEQTRMFF